MASKSAKFSWARVAIGSPDECWPWLGGKNKHGYGACHFLGRASNASRAALESIVWVVPRGHQACHTCDNRICCNPSHLYFGTNKDNAQDRVRRGRSRSVFPRGAEHPRHTARLTEDDVRKIRIRLGCGESQSSIARSYNMASMQISDIARGATWSHVR